MNRIVEHQSHNAPLSCGHLFTSHIRPSIDDVLWCAKCRDYRTASKVVTAPPEPLPPPSEQPEGFRVPEAVRLAVCDRYGPLRGPGFRKYSGSKPITLEEVGAEYGLSTTTVWKIISQAWLDAGLPKPQYSRSIPDRPVPDHVHGTSSGYGYWKCPCALCREGQRVRCLEGRRGRNP